MRAMAKGDKPKAKAVRKKKVVSKRSKPSTREIKKSLMFSAMEEHGCNVSKSCKASNIALSTHYEWMKNDPEYADKMNALQYSMVDKVEGWIYHKIFDAERDSDQIRAAEIYLKARGKDRGYGVEKREQDIKGEVDLTHHQAEVTVYIPDNGRKGTN